MRRCVAGARSHTPSWHTFNGVSRSTPREGVFVLRESWMIIYGPKFVNSGMEVENRFVRWSRIELTAAAMRWCWIDLRWWGRYLRLCKLILTCFGRFNPFVLNCDWVECTGWSMRTNRLLSWNVEFEFLCGSGSSDRRLSRERYSNVFK